jgi:hypothetical protein
MGGRWYSRPGSMRHRDPDLPESSGAGSGARQANAPCRDEAGQDSSASDAPTSGSQRIQRMEAGP